MANKKFNAIFGYIEGLKITCVKLDPVLRESINKQSLPNKKNQRKAKG